MLFAEALVTVTPLRCIPWTEQDGTLLERVRASLDGTRPCLKLTSLNFFGLLSSHASGKGLLAANGLIVIFLPIINLILAVLLILTFLSGKTCDGIQSESIISGVSSATADRSHFAILRCSLAHSLMPWKVVDNPANFDGSYPLASAVREECLRMGRREKKKKEKRTRSQAVFGENYEKRA